jgi:hypothetical protein
MAYIRLKANGVYSPSGEWRIFALVPRVPKTQNLKKVLDFFFLPNKKTLLCYTIHSFKTFGTIQT